MKSKGWCETADLGDRLEKPQQKVFKFSIKTNLLATVLLVLTRKHIYLMIKTNLLATIMLEASMSDKILKQAHGNWVKGERFWNREVEIDLFIQRLKEGAHVLLVAQRRMGKTSLMHEVARRLEGEMIPIFVDWQKSNGAEDALVEISKSLHKYKTLWDKTRDLFSNIFQSFKNNIEEVDLGEIGIKIRSGLTAGDWMIKGDQIFSILASSDKPVVLMLDEVPILVNRILKGDDNQITPERRSNADQFMSWLRENSIRHQGKINIVISGSIGFEPVLHQANLSSTINNFTPFELRPWDDETAKSCLKALANGYHIALDDEVASAMVKRLSCNIPHHVQMYFSFIHDYCTRKKKDHITVEEVEDVYRTDMLGIRGHAELTHYEERLKMVLGSEAFPFALEILTEAAVTGELHRDAIMQLHRFYDFSPRSFKDVAMEILKVLEHDGYLQPSDHGWVFVSNLIRDWWKRHYGAFHTPIAERSI